MNQLRGSKVTRNTRGPRRAATPPFTQRPGNIARESQARTARQDSVSSNRRAPQSQLRDARQDSESVNRRSERHTQLARAPEATQARINETRRSRGVVQGYQRDADYDDYSSGEHEDRQVCFHIVFHYQSLTTNFGILEIRPRSV